MKILFLYFEIHKHIEDYALLEIGVCSSLLKQNKHSVELLYLKTIPDPDDLGQAVSGFSPDLIVVYLDYDQASFISPLLEQVKSCCSRALVCGVGPLCNLIPETLIAHTAVEMLIIGEFDVALLELAEMIERGKSIENIRNTWLKTKNGIVKTPLRPPVTTLDGLPYADRTLFNHDVLVKYRNGTLVMKASRGCPYLCDFCSVSSLSKAYKTKGAFYRFRSPMHVVGELNHISQNTEIKRVLFCDYEFPLDPEWLREFKQKYTHYCNLPFIISASVERLDTPGVLETLRDTGCEGVVLGIETGNEQFRRRFADRNANNKDILRIVRKLKEFGMQIHTGNLVGLPLETPELAGETVDFNKAIEPDSIKVKTYYPPPGTPLYAYCKEKNYIRTLELPEKPYESVLNLPFMNPEDIKKAYERLHLLDSLIRVPKRKRDAGEVFDFSANLADAVIESDSVADVSLVECMIDTKPSTALSMIPGSSIVYGCDVKPSGIVQFSLMLSKAPVGNFIDEPTLNFTIEISTSGKKEIIFQRLMNPRTDANVWHHHNVSLLSIQKGRVNFIFSVKGGEDSPRGLLHGMWGSPHLADTKFPENVRIQSERGKERELDALKRAVNEKQERIDRLEHRITQILGDKSTLEKEIDRVKEHLTRTNITLLEREKTIEDLKKMIEELEHIREEYQKSLSGKFRNIMKKKKD